jgi:hypothetical protein
MLLIKIIIGSIIGTLIGYSYLTKDFLGDIFNSYIGGTIGGIGGGLIYVQPHSNDFIVQLVTYIITILLSSFVGFIIAHLYIFHVPKHIKLQVKYI